MNVYEKIKSMNIEELSRFLSAVDADLWGYCKGNITDEDIKINQTFLLQEVNSDG